MLNYIIKDEAGVGEGGGGWLVFTVPTELTNHPIITLID